MRNKHTGLYLGKIQSLLVGKNIFVTEFRDNSKACDYFIKTRFVQDDGFEHTTFIPYVYRRAYLELKTEAEVAEYLVSVKKFFTKEWMQAWVDRHKKECLEEIREKEAINKERIRKGKKPTEIVTPYVLLPLFSLKECDNVKDLPDNRNLQARIKALKMDGWTIASIQYNQKKTTTTLLPFEKYDTWQYESFTPQFKSRVIRLLKNRNAFEAWTETTNSLIPDHKFSEIRWDNETREENTMDMTDAEIIRKFQLLDNRRNQQKREICRNCFKTGLRGTIYGIKYFYEGGEEWDPTIPTIGKAAEKGCCGCPWYDIELWRQMINKKV